MEEIFNLRVFSVEGKKSWGERWRKWWGGTKTLFTSLFQPVNLRGAKIGLFCNQAVWHNSKTRTTWLKIAGSQKWVQTQIKATHIHIFHFLRLFCLLNRAVELGLCLSNKCLFLLPQYLSLVNIPHGLRHLKKLSFLGTGHYIDCDIVFMKQNVDLYIFKHTELHTADITLRVLLATAAVSVNNLFPWILIKINK